MREASLTLPSGAYDLDKLRKELNNTFGGFSSFRVYGEWKDDKGKTHDDYNTRYIIGMDDTEQNCASLRDIAIRFGRQARQLAVYLSLPSGKVEILDTATD